ncbi:hypothetical protein SAMN05216258_1147 [Albimonas pacifica]|uniref:Uncharacterized protein n=1 Tax=Albimonas pacifica TaxID=1114924 RepID=A0A1I3NPT8_9RHOB|nr:hypothetical protein SAMN05216258_1147 [Albimonas pacifica]
MNKKVWLEPKVSKLSVREMTKGTGGPPSDVCGGSGAIIDCSIP